MDIRVRGNYKFCESAALASYVFTPTRVFRKDSTADYAANLSHQGFFFQNISKYTISQTDWQRQVRQEQSAP